MVNSSAPINSRDLELIERGVNKLNDKMDVVVVDLTELRVQTAQYMSRTDFVTADVTKLRLDLEKNKEHYDYAIKAVELDLANIKTKTAPIFAIGAIILSVVLHAVINGIWPTTH